MVSSSPDQTAFVPIDQQVDSSVRRLRYRANPTLRTDEQSLFSDDPRFTDLLWRMNLEP